MLCCLSWNTETACQVSPRQYPICCIHRNLVCRADSYLQGLLPEKKVFEVHVEQGHKHASKIVLRGEAGYSEPGVEPGDVIFVLEQKQHKVFRRIHSDLVYEKVSFALLPEPAELHLHGHARKGGLS